MDEVITLQFDGGSRGNPGPAGVGVVLRAQDGTPLVMLGRFIGRATNNVAEYKALITALEQAKQLGATKIIVRGDSELIIKQMRGEYRVKHPDLRPLYEEAQYLLSQFAQSKIEHNYRESNTLADKLANLAMDRRREVTDVDDVDDSPRPREAAPASRHAAPPPPPLPRQPIPAVRRPASSSVASVPAVPAMGELSPRVGTVYTCPRCDCSVEVRNPSSQPPDGIGTFLCVCGVRMKV